MCCVFCLVVFIVVCVMLCVCVCVCVARELLCIDFFFLYWKALMVLGLKNGSLYYVLTKFACDNNLPTCTTTTDDLLAGVFVGYIYTSLSLDVQADLRY
ncbi:hypothetical protein B0T17DRAFT_387385 [Bombardia bombarda]|uniref:Uncharacterized protein n=1 Tax=Bombardia bombarda TaxID=252184 RepID=A0AA39TMM7_9PEZI|nr:hypothetical protein B0T17DRAFT_387385 [Bombardia bombarda]